MSGREALLDALRDRAEAGSSAPTYVALLEGVRPEEIANLLRDLDDAAVERVFSGLRQEAHDLGAEVLPLLDRHDIARLLRVLPDATVAGLLAEQSVDDATWMLELLHEARVGSVVSGFPAADQQEVTERLEYPEGSAGRLMSDEFLALPVTATAGDAARALQEASEDVNILYLYLVDGDGRLVGVVSLRRLLRVKPDRLLADLVPDHIVSVRAEDDQEHVARVVAENDFVCLPVLDDGGHLVGVVTHDDVLDVVREEATEDFAHMAGTTTADVISQSVWASARARMPWLLFCLGGGVVSMRLLHLREQRLGELFVVLAVFVPVILGMGGNVGTQAATLVVRGLATGRLRRHDALPVLWREARTGLVIGLTYGTLLALVAWFVLDRGPVFALVIGASLLTSMLMASCFGTLMPLAFHSVGVDPAIATGPLVTTTMDLLGILAFFGFAAWLLGA